MRKSFLVFIIILFTISAGIFVSLKWGTAIKTKITVSEEALAQTGATENLDEMITRISRYGTASWGANYLENAANNYTWQPETLMYKDVTTGHEVWVLTHAPNKGEYYSKEHGTNAWSYDGSRIGFYSYNDPWGTGRPTQNSNAGLWHFVWVVNTDGSGLRNLAESYGRRSIPFDGFSWAHTENAYYAFGSVSGDPVSGDQSYKLYKNTLNNNNVVSASLILDTSSINTLGKSMVKDGISTDDSRAVFRDMTYRVLNTPNPISSSAVYFADIKGTPSVTSWWGVARHIGPSTNNWSDPYGNHLPSHEDHFHDVWSPGPTGSFIIGQYSGGGGLFNYFKDNGSYSDGGPLWEDWNGNSFGNDEIKVISSGAGTPRNPYNTQYFGHPVWDRWGRYALVGTYEDCGNSYDGICPGTRIYDTQTNSYLPYRVLASTYDGQHHSWTGWTDYVIGVEPNYPAGKSDGYYIYANKWTDSYQSRVAVADTHYEDPNINYNAYPRPSQSPDGTKVAFAQYFLNGSQKYPYIAWAVSYYPYPPTNLSASYSSGVRLSWLPPKYTTRGWPNESTDPAPYAREIKKYHIWRSTNQTSGWQEIGSANATYYTDNPGNGTFYYALTSEEHSGLESDQLSEILKVTVSGTSVTGQVVQAKGQKNFWTTAPATPTNLSYTAQATAGQYKLNWTQPNDTKVRYYNIYYSNSTNPTAIQQQRIASVPTGTATYLDWLADASSAGHYGITSVDRYGNESAIVLSSTGDTTPPAAPTGVAVQ